MKVRIHIPKDLLEAMEQYVEGENRNQKILKCLEKGLEVNPQP